MTSVGPGWQYSFWAEEDAVGVGGPTQEIDYSAVRSHGHQMGWVAAGIERFASRAGTLTRVSTRRMGKLRARSIAPSGWRLQQIEDRPAADQQHNKFDHTEHRMEAHGEKHDELEPDHQQVRRRRPALSVDDLVAKEDLGRDPKAVKGAVAERECRRLRYKRINLSRYAEEENCYRDNE